jgi:hypothetical protein
MTRNWVNTAYHSLPPFVIRHKHLKTTPSGYVVTSTMRSTRSTHSRSLSPTDRRRQQQQQQHLLIRLPPIPFYKPYRPHSPFVAMISTTTRSVYTNAYQLTLSFANLANPSRTTWACVRDPHPGLTRSLSSPHAGSHSFATATLAGPTHPV